jgi:hypothetical protein
VSLNGTVINLNAFGATVRLENGELARANSDDVEANRSQYERSLARRSPMPFLRNDGRGRATVRLVPQISDENLEQQIASYLKTIEEREGDTPAHERHFLRKKRRAAHWEVK